MPTVTVTEGPNRAANTEQFGSRSSDAARAARPRETVTGAVVPVSTEQREPARNAHVTHVKVQEGRALTDAQRKMLDNLDKHGDVHAGQDTTVTVREGSPAAEAKAEPGRAQGSEPAQAPAEGAKEPAPVPDQKPAATEAKPAGSAKPAEAPVQDAELKARYERVLEHNKRLVDELEARDKAASDAMDDRLKELDAIERDWGSDALGAMRRMVALNAGVKPDDPMVDRLMGHIYKEWTGAEFKVAMDDGTRAAIGTDRNRLLIERDKRDRAAAQRREEERAKKAEAERRAQSAVKYLEEQLGSKYAGKYDLEHAQLFDNVSPAHALFSAISRGIAAGQHKQDDPDDVLIEHYARELEGRYKPRLSRLEEFFSKKLEPVFEKKFKASTPAPSTSTTTPGQPQASEARDQAAGATRDGARTLTNASASVAPPAPPAETTPAKEDKQPPKWRNEEERRRYYARLHFDGA